MYDIMQPTKELDAMDLIRVLEKARKFHQCQVNKCKGDAKVLKAMTDLEATTRQMYRNKKSDDVIGLKIASTLTRLKKSIKVTPNEIQCLANKCGRQYVETLKLILKLKSKIETETKPKPKPKPKPRAMTKTRAKSKTRAMIRTKKYY
jgi:hypothetical protein